MLAKGVPAEEKSHQKMISHVAWQLPENSLWQQLYKSPKNKFFHAAFVYVCEKLAQIFDKYLK